MSGQDEYSGAVFQRFIQEIEAQARQGKKKWTEAEIKDVLLKSLIAETVKEAQ